MICLLSLTCCFLQSQTGLSQWFRHLHYCPGVLLLCCIHFVAHGSNGLRHMGICSCSSWKEYAPSSTLCLVLLHTTTLSLLHCSLLTAIFLFSCNIAHNKPAIQLIHLRRYKSSLFASPHSIIFNSYNPYNYHLDTHTQHSHTKLYYHTYEIHSHTQQINPPRTDITSYHHIYESYIPLQSSFYTL